MVELKLCSPACLHVLVYFVGVCIIVVGMSIVTLCSVDCKTQMVLVGFPLRPCVCMCLCVCVCVLFVYMCIVCICVYIVVMCVFVPVCMCARHVLY